MPLIEQDFYRIARFSGRDDYWAVRFLGIGFFFNIALPALLYTKCPILIKKAGVKTIPCTKIELNHNKIAKIQGLDELSKLLFPGNKSHQRIFLAVFIEIKWAPDQFLGSLMPLCDKYTFSSRMLETVRSKMRRMGLIDHVSPFQ